MQSTKCEGLSYPSHFLKFMVVLLGIFFLNTELNKLHFLTTNKAKHILNRHFSCSCSDTIYSKTINKNINKNRKKSLFLKFTFSLLVNIF